MATAAAMGDRAGSALRPLFIAIVFLGSFLLFLIQPLFARLVLPVLGGSPSVWNTAMLFWQAVLLLGYEWFQAAAPASAPAPDHVPAPHGEVAGLIAHLDHALDEAGYYHVPDRTPATRRTLAALLTRPQFTTEEVRTLRGIIRALAEARKKRA